MRLHSGTMVEFPVEAEGPFEQPLQRTKRCYQCNTDIITGALFWGFDFHVFCSNSCVQDVMLAQAELDPVGVPLQVGRNQ